MHLTLLASYSVIYCWFLPSRGSRCNDELGINGAMGANHHCCHRNAGLPTVLLVHQHKVQKVLHGELVGRSVGGGQRVWLEEHSQRHTLPCRVTLVSTRWRALTRKCDLLLARHVRRLPTTVRRGRLQTSACTFREKGCLSK